MAYQLICKCALLCILSLCGFSNGQKNTDVVPGPLVFGGFTSKDNNDPQYRKLAEESLKKYVLESGATEPHIVVSVDEVKTQVVAGTHTSLLFTAIKNDVKVLKCHSKILEQSWLNKVKYDVNCDSIATRNRRKRQIRGGHKIQNNNAPEYRKLAEESLNKYVQETGATEPHRIVSVDKVTTQVVSGSLTNIFFTVNKNVNDVLQCHSKVWEQSWLNKVKLNVSCSATASQVRRKRQIPGGETLQNHHAPKYRKLAEESLNKYVQETGATEPHRIVSVDKVTTQVVSGSLTNIFFTVNKNVNDVLQCHSKVWEQSWLNKVKLNVSCSATASQVRRKRQIPGGETLQNHHAPKYRKLAEESLNKYVQETGATEPHRIVSVDKVTTQVVSGSLTNIFFTVNKNVNDVLQCHSKVWEQSWLNKVKLNVSCSATASQVRRKRQIPGGETLQNHHAPKYRKLAEESLNKYVQETGATEPHRIVSVDKVTTQVVSGSLTNIFFTVNKNVNDVLQCHSKVWEQSWLNKVKLNVSCSATASQVRRKRQIPGGETLQNHHAPKYRKLAEESLNKYVQETGATEPHRIVSVDKVTTQVVSGSLTNIFFTVNKNVNDVLQCHSKVWEQSWLNKVELNVKCRPDN